MTPHPATPPDDDPILAATSVEEFVAAIDEVYGLDVPTVFPAGTTLAALWALQISVERAADRRRYVATAREDYPFARSLSGVVVVALDASDDPLGSDPLSARREEHRP